MLARLAPPECRLSTLAMGTWFDVLVHAADPIAARAAAEAAVEVVDTLHHQLSRFEASSLLAHLRRAAPEAVAVDRDTFELFREAESVRRQSRGAFDVAFRHRAAAEPAITLDPVRQTIGLRSSAVELDLGGIAKGHAIDLAGRALGEAGVIAAFVHGGTSSGLGIGRPPAGTWRVAIGALPGAPIVDLTDRAFSVSSTRARAHLTDPRTGRRVARHRRVALIGRTARSADAWSTALMVDSELELPDGLVRVRV
jgi:thiamine biosynthesis lipoprotein